MRILFYSTSSSVYDENLVSKTFPTYAQEFEDLAKKYAEYDFIIATQLPGMFLLDLSHDELAFKAKSVQYEIIKEDKEEEIADFLETLKPDLAIAVTFYTVPFDWLTAKDALVAEYLEKKGIKTICHNLQTALDCFDKWKTHNLLQRLNIKTPKAVYIHHELFINAANRTFVKSNVYKSAVLHEIEELNFPVIIKDTTGFSSYGTDVLENFEQVKNFLKSKKFTSDKIVEEFIKGAHLGTQIIGKPKGRKIVYEIEPPFLFSVNKYGITSPKQSEKAGPVNSKRYKIHKLNKILKHLSRACRFKGIAQVDLIFDGKDWFVIEINPRLSGMTTTYAHMQGKTVCETFLDSAQFLLKQSDGAKKTRTKRQKSKYYFTLNIKLSLADEYESKEFLKKSYIKKVYEIKNLAAQQLRERGYCELILTAKTKDELLENLEDLNNTYAQKMEKIFYENAKELIKKL
ncbi:ATP-grasp domain-containing protein [Treponema pectinovorum]|uniref:ATP-grasp domain-containing protein n=1 Tax=Treponema pectinovorum TaxID=164 RepID=UPI0011C9E778|nr:ATP-grasp domain-containing protein [Treponema pectinovorum]